jgi:DNA-binding HxlR family transcriptional regulator
MAENLPFPGGPVRGSKSGKPIMALFDLLGRSWAMGILWQLADQPHTFRSLQSACEGVSPSVLNKRLKELRACGLVAQDGGYCLTGTGQELFQLLQPFGPWACKWADGLNGHPPG